MVAQSIAYHVVDSAEHSVAAVPVTKHPWVMLCLVSCKIFLTRETPTCRLWAIDVTAKEGLGVTFVVLP
jgi:hypothetical protein